MMASRVNELKGLGFELSGRFVATPTKVRVQVLAHSKDRGVYALVIGESVRYVGETSDNLQRRVSEYAKPSQSQTTSSRVNRLMRKEVAETDALCELWFLPDSTIEKGRLYLDLGGTRLQGVPDRSAVKNTLISRWDPLWNRR